MQKKTSSSHYLGTRSPRCFEAPVTEQSAQMNYFCGTFTTAPKPGSYDDDISIGSTQSKRVQSPIRSTSPRIMSNSRHWWLSQERDAFPPQFTSKIPELTHDMIKAKIALIKRQLKILYTKNEVDSSDAIKYEINELKKKLKDYHIMQDSCASQSTPIRPKPLRVPFLSSGKRNSNNPITDMIKDDKHSIPHYFRAESDWDFGLDQRSKAISMNAYGYTDKYRRQLQQEETTRIDVMVGLNRPASRCRNTDFFGPIANALIKQRSSAPELAAGNARMLK